MQQTSGGKKRALWRWFFPAGAVGLVAAAIWSPAFLLNVAGRLQRYDVVRSIPYASGDRRALDIYRPRDAHGAPVIVFFYGGSWQTGDKAMYLFLASTLAARGYVVVVPDYRVYPEVKFPAFLQDGALALRWTKEYIANYGGDAARVFIMGHSAGAYIAAMLAIDGQWLNGVGLDPLRDVAGLIGVSGPYNFLPLQDDTLKIIFEGDNRVQTQPITFAVGKKPPALLLTGADDQTVRPQNSSSLAAKLRSEGNAATEIVYPRFGHIPILLAFAPFVSNWFPVLADIDTFVGQTKSVARNAAVAAAREAP